MQLMLKFKYSARNSWNCLMDLVEVRKTNDVKNNSNIIS